VYARYDLNPDIGVDEDTEATADDEVDTELLKCAEHHWEARVLRTLAAWLKNRD
jgi:hypothetical protein